MVYNEQELSQKLSEIRNTHLRLTLEHWLKYEIFTWQWWGKFIYLIIPLIVFYKLLDRKRSFEIVTYGLLISLFSTVIDVVCVNFVWYSYPIRLLPVGFFAVHDLIFIPIVSMLFYQYNSNWKRFVIANLILSGLGAYIKEPFLTWIKVYEPIHWNHMYSFILFFIMTVVCKCIVDKIKKGYIKSLA